MTQHDALTNGTILSMAFRAHDHLDDEEPTCRVCGDPIGDEPWTQDLSGDTHDRCNGLLSPEE